MQFVLKTSVLFILTLGLAFVFQLRATETFAQSSYFSSRGCVDCHGAPTVATCAGCHEHSGTITATKNKTTAYAPGEMVTITLTSSGARSGWIGVRLYNQSGVQIASSTGNQSGMGGSTTFGTASAVSAPAPATAGSYTWRIAYYGNENGDGSGDVHSEISRSVAITVASATAAPTVSSISPTSMVQGTTNSTLTINGTNLTGATVAFSGSGITTGTATVSASSITLPVTVATSATTGARTLTVTTAGGSATSAFTVNAAPVPAPTISSISPSSMVQGTTNSTLTINGTNLTGATVAFSGSGITTGTATVTATSITLPVTVATSATTGARTLAVTTAGGSATSTFTVNAAPVAAPTISSISPASMVQGTTNSTLTINGTNLTGATVAFSGSGVTFSSATVGASSISMPVTVATTATTGARTVTVTTAGGSASTTFTVTAAPVPAPTVSSVIPTSITQGTTTTLTINGTNLTGATVVFNGIGITGGTVTTTATSITLPVTVATSAATGGRTLTVATAGGSATSAFVVTSAPMSGLSGASLTVVDPSTGADTFKVASNGDVTGSSFAVKDAEGVNKFVVNTKGYAGVGSDNPKTPIFIDTAVSPEISWGLPVFLIQGVDNRERFELRSLWAPVFQGRQFNGTIAEPSATTTDKILFALGGGGYDGTAFTANQATVIMRAAEDWSTTAKGSYITFETTPSGSATAPTEKLRISGAGNVGVGTSTPTQKLEVNGGVRINTATSKPTCNTATRGTLWITQDLINDFVEVCAMVNGNLVWKTL